MLKLIFRPKAGGLLYHLRAKKCAQGLWQPFRTHLETALENLTSDKITTAILVGPSGGYCLTSKYLSRFKKVIAIDPDPRAERQFKKIHQNIPIEWLKYEAFGFGQNQFQLLDQLYNANPNKTVIIFCNVLGQIPYLKSSPFTEDSLELRIWQSELRKFLQNKYWISFHDRLSVDHTEISHQVVPAADSLTDQQLVQTFDLKPQNLLSHLTDELFPSGERDYLSWRLSARRTHIIECVGSR